MSQLSGLNVPENSLNLQANDMRQEPPIPVERIVITEKSIVETQKSIDNILVTFAPVIKKIVDQIKRVDTDFHKESNNLIKNDIIITTKVATEDKEEINLMKKKESFIDKRKHYSLINSDAIKKEDSELAAYAEAANMLVAERHEKLRKTLEKHKQEQLQMVEEQKEILKDLKEQKQEIERQKQKDTEEYKKGKNDLKVLSGKSVIQAKMNSTIISNSNENESSKNQRENINNKTFKSALSNNENMNKRQNIQLDTYQMLFDNKLNNKKLKEVGVSPNNSKKLLKGPILNALTKRVLQRSISTDDLRLNNSETDYNKNNFSNIISNLQGKSNVKLENLQYQYSLPIALKMRNQTNVENSLEEHKSEGTVQLIRRDILENHEREKREINIRIEETNTKVTSDISNESEYLIKNFTTKDNREECFKGNEKVEGNLINELKNKTNQNSSENDTAKTSLIKTNIYLSEQGFGNAVSIDSNIPIRGEYVKLKQRDLKFVNIGEDYNI